MPYIKSSFTGNKYISNGHLETIIPALFRKVQVNYKRERLTLSDGDFIDLDQVKNNHTKLLVLFHGLEGSSESQYMKGFAKYFSERGYDICAVNFRSCSGEPNRLLQSYHSGATADVHEVLSYLCINPLYTSVYITAFSLGGNVLLKYLGDGIYMPDLRIKAVTTFSVPIDLAGGSIQLAKLSNKIYMFRFLKTLNDKLRNKALRFKGQLNLEGLNQVKTFTDWDTRFTAPLHGFHDAADYYTKCSSKQFLKNIKIPALLVNALNDPFLSMECYPLTPEETGPALYFESPEDGGHVGFMLGLPNGDYYSEQRASVFFNEYY